MRPSFLEIAASLIRPTVSKGLTFHQVVIACDGIGSPVAKWMGFPEPKYVGHCAFRGLGYFPEGQPFNPRVNYIYGKGIRAAYVPVSSTKVYWFVCFNSSSPGILCTHGYSQVHLFISQVANSLQNEVLIIKQDADLSSLAVPCAKMLSAHLFCFETNEPLNQIELKI